jgi:hypothetical protein
MATASFSKYKESSLAFARGYGGGFRRRRAWIYTPLKGGSALWRWFLGKDCWEWLQMCVVKNPKGFGFYL